MLTAGQLKEHSMTKQFLNLKNAGAFIGVSARTVRRLIDRKQLAYYKIGSLIKIDEEDLMEYLKCSRVEATNNFKNGDSYEK